MAAAFVACDGEPTSPERTPPSTPPEIEFRVGVIHWSVGDTDHSYQYTWTNDNASRVTVSRVSEPMDVVWEIIDESGSGIASGLLHGSVPVGARATVSVGPHLMPGVGIRYRVTVTLLGNGRTASAEFRP